MGHSSLSSGSLNSSSSNNSAAPVLQASLCFGQCDIWQSRQQYLAILQDVQVLSVFAPSSALPQFAHVDISRLLVVFLRSSRRPKKSAVGNHSEPKSHSKQL